MFPGTQYNRVGQKHLDAGECASTRRLPQRFGYHLYVRLYYLYNTAPKRRCLRADKEALMRHFILRFSSDINSSRNYSSTKPMNTRSSMGTCPMYQTSSRLVQTIFAHQVRT